MDSFAFRAGNAIVGNDFSDAVLEWALAGGAMRVGRDCAFCHTGAGAVVRVGTETIAPYANTVAHAGDEIVVEQIASGRFIYFCFTGGVDVPLLLGSRSTYLPGRFGGFEGRMLRTGDTIGVADPNTRMPAPGFHCAADLLPRYDSGIVHVTGSPQSGHFDEAAWQIFTSSDYRVSSSSDRTGYRLEGAAVGKPPASLPSEAGCPGAIQVPSDGLPIALMADAPTVGGYAKIAVVTEADMPILAQTRPGDPIRFELVTLEQSHRALRRRESDLQTIRQLALRSAAERSESHQ